MEHIWLKQYPESVPAEIDINKYQSVVDIIEESIERFRNQVAYVNMDVTMTFAELEEKTRAFAAYLQNEMGLKKGERVAIMSPNVLQYPVAAFGILRAGGVVVNTNPLYTERELEHQLNDADVQAIVILQNSMSVLDAVIDKTPVKTVIHYQIGDMFPFIKRKLVNAVVKKKGGLPPVTFKNAVSFRDCLAKGAKLSYTRPELTHKDMAFLQYTGGTTGVAKGAVLSHKNMTANIQQAKEWLMPHVNEGKEIIFTALPLYHIFALTANCFTHMALGSKNVLITDPRNMDSFVKELGKYPITTITGVNTLFNGLVSHPDFAKLDLSTLKFALGGGAAVQRAVSDKWKALTGNPIVEAYGLTETSPAATMNRCDIEEHTGRIGIPISSTELACMDLVDGKLVEVPQGERGEICIRGPQVMEGYWGRPEATAESISEDGWFRTGDVGVMDEKGLFQIVDRLKDMILVSGFNVFPNEIEDAIAKHPKVLEVACIGVPDERAGEAVKVFIVKSDDSLTAEEMKEFCKENMTGYKVPKHYDFREELPKSNVGKILRKDLREEEMKKAEAAS